MVNKTKFIVLQTVMPLLFEDIIDVIVKVLFICDEVGMI